MGFGGIRKPEAAVQEEVCRLALDRSLEKTDRFSRPPLEPQNQAEHARGVTVQWIDGHRLSCFFDALIASVLHQQQIEAVHIVSGDVFRLQLDSPPELPCRGRPIALVHEIDIGERVMRFGKGVVELESSPGGGTTARVTLPLEGEVKA